MPPAALWGVGQRPTPYRQRIASIHLISSHRSPRTRAPRTTNSLQMSPAYREQGRTNEAQRLHEWPSPYLHATFI